MKNKDFESSDTIVRFSRLIHKSFEWGSDFIPLRSEIELVEDYLKIQVSRRRNKLEYQIHTNSQYDNIAVPKFILQPLVENAISHGIETKKEGGRIEIFCGLCGDSIKITVSDNGSGMPLEVLKTIRQRLDNWSVSTESSHIGILNVHQRLKLYYGEKYGVEIHSEQGIRTSVSISFPVPPESVSPPMD